MAQQRVVVLVDMDCFYVQVEQRANPELKGKPCAVVQYKKWKGGGIIAVGYEARACGVTRSMRGDDAKAKCPAIRLVHVPEVRGKADLTKYRDAGAEVIEVLSRFSKCVERASIDEAYIDMTEEVNDRLEKLRLWHGRILDSDLNNTWVVGWERARQIADSGEVTTEETSKPSESDRAAGLEEWLHEVYEGSEVGINNQRLAIAAQIAEEMRAAVYRDTGFRCSAGIAHNKMLAKLVCGLHKPNRQTILPHDSVPILFNDMPVTKVRGFGGKFGALVKGTLGVEFMAQLVQFSQQHLVNVLGEKSGTWLYGVCRGIENEPVSDRQLPKSIGCSKNFNGKEALNTKQKIQFWLSELSKEVEERLVKDREMNNRVAKNLVVSLHQERIGNASSRTCAIVRYDAQKFASDAFTLLKRYDTAPATSQFWQPSVVNLSVVANKFVDIDDSAVAMKSFLTKKPASSSCATSLSYSAQSQSAESQMMQSQSLFSQSTQSQIAPSQSVSSHLGQIPGTPVSRAKSKRGSISNFFSQAAPSNSVHSPVSADQASATANWHQTNRASEGATNSTMEGMGFRSMQMSGNSVMGNMESRTTLKVSDKLDISHSEGKQIEGEETTEIHRNANQMEGCDNWSENESNFSNNCIDVTKAKPVTNQSDLTPNNANNVTDSNAENTPKNAKLRDNEHTPDGVKPSNSENTPNDAKPAKRGFFATKMLELKKKREMENSLSVQRGATTFSSYQVVHNRNPELHANDRDQGSVKELGNSVSSGAQRNVIYHEIVSDNELKPSCSNSGVDSDVLVDNTDYSKCEECGCTVSAWDLPEHLDFHFAQKLQKEQQQQQRTGANAVSGTPIGTGKSGTSGTSTKRKLETTKSKTANKRARNSTSQTNNTAQKTLDGFFRRS